MKNFGKRILQDRRKESTPALSRFTLWGQRRSFRREEDKKRGGYVDRYGSGLLFLLILAVGLNVLDALFTMMILDDAGWEINPVVRSVIQLYGDRFWVWKFAIVSTSLIVLCLHSNFGRARTFINAAGFIYASVVLYQIFLISYWLPEIP